MPGRVAVHGPDDLHALQALSSNIQRHAGYNVTRHHSTCMHAGHSKTANVHTPNMWQPAENFCQQAHGELHVAAQQQNANMLSCEIECTLHGQNCWLSDGSNEMHESGGACLQRTYRFQLAIDLLGCARIRCDDCQGAYPLTIQAHVFGITLQTAPRDWVIRRPRCRLEQSCYCFVTLQASSILKGN